MFANVRVYELRFSVLLLYLDTYTFKNRPGQTYSLKTKLYLHAQALTAIGYTRCWVQLLLNCGFRFIIFDHFAEVFIAAFIKVFNYKFIYHII